MIMWNLFQRCKNASTFTNQKCYIPQKKMKDKNYMTISNDAENIWQDSTPTYDENSQ